MSQMNASNWMTANMTLRRNQVHGVMLDPGASPITTIEGDLSTASHDTSPMATSLPRPRALGDSSPPSSGVPALASNSRTDSPYTPPRRGEIRSRSNSGTSLNGDGWTSDLVTAQPTYVNFDTSRGMEQVFFRLHARFVSTVTKYLGFRVSVILLLE